MKSESTVSGSSESETSALIVAVLGIILNVHDFRINMLVLFLFFLFKSGLVSNYERGGRDCTDLFIPKLNQPFFILHNLIPLIHTFLEQLGQSQPLPSHLVSIIRVHELIIIYTVRRIPLHSFDGRFA